MPKLTRSCVEVWQFNDNLGSVFMLGCRLPGRDDAGKNEGRLRSYVSALARDHQGAFGNNINTKEPLRPLHSYCTQCPGISQQSTKFLSEDAANAAYLEFSDDLSAITGQPLRWTSAYVTDQGKIQRRASGNAMVLQAKSKDHHIGDL